MDTDHATQWNGVGFNGVDSDFGHSLAAREALTLPMLRTGYKMVKKYRKQLERAGYTLPTPEAVEMYIGEKLATPPAPVTVQPVQEPTIQAGCVYLQQGRIVVKFDYDAAKVAAMQPLKKSIKEWAFNKFGLKEWSFPKSEIEKVLEALAQFDDFSYDEKVAAAKVEAEAQAELARQQAEIESQRREAEKQVTLANAQPVLEGEPLPSGDTLFAHQKEAVRTMLEWGRAILAHDMGLGKTKSALVAAKAYDLPIIVICPATLRINWLREAESVGVQIEVYSWAKIPPAPETNYVLICDEAHYMQNLKSNRTQAALDMVDNARAVFLLTGTPLKNGRPANLFPLLKATRHELATDKKAYEIRYCNGHLKVVNRQGTEVWDVTGASHLDELHKKTRDVILYKQKEDCIDLPEKTRVMRVAEVSPEAAKAYKSLLEELKARHQASAQAKQKAYTEAAQAYLAAVERGEAEDMEAPEAPDPESAEALVELGALRHAGSIAKVESAVELAQEVLEQGQHVMLFTAYVDSANAIASELGCRVLRGSVSVEQKQEMIDCFQSGHEKALVCTLGAGGVGITLTAAQTVILVDRPWTPGDAEQAEDRLHRIGQKSAVTAIWLQYGAIDEKIDTLLQEKQERIDLVLEGKRKSMRGVSKSIRAIAEDILAEVLAGK
jgi:SNF2 family DNA or RNA helicase